MSKASAAFAETCRVLFNAADDDGNASLDPEEFRAVLQSDALGLKLTPQELDDVLASADADGDGTITLDEFIPVVRAS
jgi:Ca2+-binding EF-hand superfamily protein